MTLAADGHSVKVHQIILALASPYIKELIASAHCSHPIIFLNVSLLFFLSVLITNTAKACLRHLKKVKC